MSVALMTQAFKARIKPTQKLVLLALCDCANDQGECYPSVQTLVEKCSSGERTIQEAVAALERAETGLFSTDDGALVSRGLRAVSEKWWLPPGGHAAASKLMQAATRCGRAGRMSGAVRKQCLDLLLAGVPCSAMYADCVMRWMTIVAEAPKP